MKQLQRNSVWLFFVHYLRLSLVLILFVAFFLTSMVIRSTDLEFNLNFWLGVFGVLLWLSWSLLWAYLSYHYYRYDLTDKGFQSESGVVFKKYVTIPYNRIQNVDIYRGLWARILGLSDLNIQTAGMSGVGRYSRISPFAEGRLPGLSIKEAETVRDDLINRASHKSDLNQPL